MHFAWAIEELYETLYYNSTSGMKFSMVLLAIILRSLSDTKAEPIQLSAHNAGNFRVRPLAPLLYQKTLLGLRPIQRCFKNNMLTTCSAHSESLPFSKYVSRNVPQPVVTQIYWDPTNIYTISPSEKLSYRRMYDADLAHVDLEIPRRLISPFEAQPVKNLNLKLEKPNMKPIVKYLHEIYSVKTSSEKLEETLSEINIDAVETSFENVKTMGTTSLSVDTAITTPAFMENITSAKETVVNVNITPMDQNSLPDQNNYESLIFALDQFERKLYVTNFAKFTALTPASKGDSGMSFVQSGLFLEMALMVLSTEVDLDTKNEIDLSLGMDLSDLDKITLIKQVVTSLPDSSDELKFRWSCRLVLRSGRQVSEEFSTGTAAALRLRIDNFKVSETPEAMVQVLNKMIEKDSGGAIRDTFEEDDLAENEEAVLITTLYFRARWRSAPTLLNGTWLFRDSGNASSRTVRMIRINDVMKYIDLPEWDAEAIEISYSTQGLSLLMLIPRGNSLKPLVRHMTSANLASVTKRMETIRVAATLPLYTLRMTLLLPNKLQAMGISRLVNASEAMDGSFRISQAVQRIMFWAEAGRNAYKDDGLEWDDKPEMEIAVNRPYMFFVRWQNLTLLNGNFVL